MKIATRFLGIAALLCGTQFFINPRLPRFNPDKAPVARCDQSAIAAVVYTGTPDRVREGLVLLNEGKVCKLLISGINNSKRESLDNFLGHFGVPVPPTSSISTDTAPTTKDNANSSALWVKRHPEIKDVVLITSSMHMSRAFILTERAFKNAKVNAHLTVLPVNDFKFNWHSPFSHENACYLGDWGIERAKLTATVFGLKALPWGHIRVASGRKPMAPHRTFRNYAQATP